MCYFIANNDDFEDLDAVVSVNRKAPLAGDILGLSFRNKGYSYSFEGLCIKCKKKKSISPETTLTLRNILGSVGIEISCSYFYNRLFLMRINNFKRKEAFYSRSKLYYIRHKLNRASRV